jgi:hypothetical protein
MNSSIEERSPWEDLKGCDENHQQRIHHGTEVFRLPVEIISPPL